MSEQEPSQAELLQIQVAQAFAEESLPHLYSNGFIIGYGNADIHLVLQRNGVPVGTLNLSFTIAKTLAERLATLLADLEEISGREIMTTNMIDDFKRSRVTEDTEDDATDEDDD